MDLIDVVQVVRCKNCSKTWCYLRQELGEEGFCSAGEHNHTEFEEDLSDGALD